MDSPVKQQLLRQAQRYTKLSEVLSLLQQAREVQRLTEGEGEGVRASELKQHIKTALDEAIRLRADTEALQSSMHQDRVSRHLCFSFPFPPSIPFSLLSPRILILFLPTGEPASKHSKLMTHTTGHKNHLYCSHCMFIDVAVSFYTLLTALILSSKLMCYVFSRADFRRLCPEMPASL